MMSVCGIQRILGHFALFVLTKHKPDVYGTMWILCFTSVNSLRLAKRIYENFCKMLCSLQTVFSDSQIQVCYAFSKIQ